MILIVEDNAISRTDFAETLRKFGYGVLEASDGAEAIAHLEQHHAHIDLVITDMVLPPCQRAHSRQKHRDEMAEAADDHVLCLLISRRRPKNLGRQSRFSPEAHQAVRAGLVG